MDEIWRSGTCVVSSGAGETQVTVVLDDVDEASAIMETVRQAEIELDGVEVLASFAGPSRGTAEVVADILVVIQQNGLTILLGATGSGVWASVQALLSSAVRRRRAKQQGGVGGGDGQRELRQTVTVMIPTSSGPAYIHRVTIGPADAEQLSLERIVQSLVDSTKPPSST